MSFLVSSGYTVFGFIFDITVVVFIHELGHFAVGRWCGVQVDAFSIGFGPELFAWTDRHGTRWRIAALPLGGYVKFHGDLNAASAGVGESLAGMSEAERSVTFQAQPVAKRAAIVAAGPIANFILAMVILTGLIYVEGVPASDARIGMVGPGTAAAAAGFRPGDVVKAIDGKPVANFAAMQEIVTGSSGTALHFDILRDAADVGLDAVPETKVEEGKDGPVQVRRLGVRVAMEGTTLPRAVADAGRTCWNIVSVTGHYVGGLIMGREKADQLSGPIGIASVAGQAARMGIGSILNLITLLSVSIGLMNLMPVPLLDGGHLLYYAYEAIRGRPMSHRAQEFGFKIGLALVSMLMIFATYNDIARQFHG